MSFWIQYPDLIFEEEFHRYFWKGVQVQGVTQIFDRIGIRKNDQEPFYPIGCPDFCKSETASDFGSAFHRIPEIHYNGGMVRYPDEMEPWAESFFEFANKNPLTPLEDARGNKLIEYPMYSVTYRYAGTPDLIALDSRGVINLLDWKTSTTYSKTYALQTAAYEQLVREVLGYKREKIVRKTILFAPDGYKVFSGEKKDWNTYLSLYNTLKFAA